MINTDFWLYLKAEHPDAVVDLKDQTMAYSRKAKSYFRYFDNFSCENEFVDMPEGGIFVISEYDIDGCKKAISYLKDQNWEDIRRVSYGVLETEPFCRDKDADVFVYQKIVVNRYGDVYATATAKYSDFLIESDCFSLSGFVVEEPLPLDSALPGWEESIWLGRCLDKNDNVGVKKILTAIPKPFTRDCREMLEDLISIHKDSASTSFIQNAILKEGKRTKKSPSGLGL